MSVLSSFSVSRSSVFRACVCGLYSGIMRGEGVIPSKCRPMGMFCLFMAPKIMVLFGEKRETPCECNLLTVLRISTF